MGNKKVLMKKFICGMSIAQMSVPMKDNHGQKKGKTGYGTTTL